VPEGYRYFYHFLSGNITSSNLCQQFNGFVAQRIPFNVLKSLPWSLINPFEIKDWPVTDCWADFQLSLLSEWQVLVMGNKITHSDTNENIHCRRLRKRIRLLFYPVLIRFISIRNSNCLHFVTQSWQFSLPISDRDLPFILLFINSW